MCCNLWDAVEERAVQTDSQSVLAGTLVSSLHRLKDIDNLGKCGAVEDHSLAGAYTVLHRWWLLRVRRSLSQG